MGNDVGTGAPAWIGYVAPRHHEQLQRGHEGGEPAAGHVHVGRVVEFAVTASPARHRSDTPIRIIVGRVVLGERFEYITSDY